MNTRSSTVAPNSQGLLRRSESLLRLRQQAIVRAKHYEDLTLKGFTVAQIALREDTNQTQVYYYLYLSRLPPDIQDAIQDQKLNERDRLAISVGAVLGAIPAPTTDELMKLCHTLVQCGGLSNANVVPTSLSSEERRIVMLRLLLEAIKKLGLRSPRAKTFVKVHTHHIRTREIEIRRLQNNPRSELKFNLIAFKAHLRTIANNKLVEWSPKELRSALSEASTDEIESYRRELQEAINSLTDFDKLLARIVANPQPKTY